MAMTAVDHLGTLTGHSKVDSKMQSLNDRKRRPLTPFERRLLDTEEEAPFYIYNVSPIHEWARPQGQLGTITIPKRDWKAVVSEPVVIKGAVVRWVNKGLMTEPFIEGGDDIVKDICGCGDTADGRHPNSNLLRFGVFYTVRPFDVANLPLHKRESIEEADNKVTKDQLLQQLLTPKHEQKSLIAEATAKLMNALQDRILEADNWHSNAATRNYIGSIHRDSLLAFNTISGKKETRPWAGVMTGETLEACEFCGTMVRPGLLKCPNCLEVLNQEAYDKAKAGRA